MSTTATRPKELTLPVASLAALRDALVSSVGQETGAHALRSAGYAAGDAFYRVLTAAEGDDPTALPAARFWSRLSLLFSSRGWGQLAYGEAHPGVGALQANDWVEARDTTADQPACHFTTGVLANLLGQVAGAEVAVLEVECRSRGDQRCRFLFGGADAVFAVYEKLADGTAPDIALTQLS